MLTDLGLELRTKMSSQPEAQNEGESIFKNLSLPIRTAGEMEKLSQYLSEKENFNTA